MSRRAMALSARDAREAVALAVRIHGAKRGWHIAAGALGISARTARAIEGGETSGATIPEDKAFEARMQFRRARAAQLRAELASLEEEQNASCVARHGAGFGLGR